MRARRTMTGRRALLAAAVLAVVLTAATGGGSAAARATVAPAPLKPVSTLDPRGTALEWRRLVAHPQRFRAAADCRPLRAVFYAATDWLRLATRLAAAASPCAQYYISIPPLSTDKTTIRPDQAWRIRALGSNFHAMAEIQWAGWARWVAANSSSWFAAGVEARRRMAAAGFDVSKGNTWAVNEFPSSVRAVAGADRANAREFVRGLYEGDGGPPVKGTVFVIGVGQRSTSIPLYQNNMQNWFGDAAFWADMAAYVSDWSQEVYADFRSYGVPGAPIEQRRDYLNDYLQHELVLANVGPPAVAAARSYLQSAYSPLANAAWQWPSAYGWTMVTVDQMEGFVSAQTYALRYFSATSGEPIDHWGFAWQPRNGTGLSSADFATQTRTILDRLAAAIRDSGQTTDPSDPGSAACGPPGQNLACGGDLPGAAFTEAWKSFRAWTLPVLAFTTAPQTIQAGAPSAAMTLALETSTGQQQTATAPIAITLGSSSPKGLFATNPAGPWTPTLTLTIQPGTGATGPFYYEDTQAGTSTLTAAAAGVTSGTQSETILPGPAVAVSVKPTSATIAARGTQTFGAAGIDQFGNASPVTATWSLSAGTLGTLRPASGPSTTLTAGPRAARGRVTGIAAGPTGTLSASATVTVQPGRITVAAIRYGTSRKTLLVTTTVIDSRRNPVAGAVVRLIVRRNGYRFFLGQRRAAANGKALFRLRLKKGCFRASIIRAAAAGYVWRPGTPPNRFCR